MTIPETSQPNILLITTDQQRYDTIGPRAPAFLRTPHLDDLSRQGIGFAAAYADCPLCVPSRVSIMTGRTVDSHGMANNGKTSDVMQRDRTLPTRLRELGYQTAAIGKMHFTPQRARHGFDEMILPADYYQEMARSGHPQQPMRHGLGQNEMYAGLATVPEALTLTSWTADQCADYIRYRRDPTAPFFLWCSFAKPHPPLDPPEPYYSMYREVPIPEPVVGEWSQDGSCPQAFARFRDQQSFDLLTPEIIRAARTAYYGLVTQIDYAIGRLFGALRDVAMYDDTLILFTSDHGDYLGDHGTAAKMFFHEPSAHVPFLLSLPKRWDDRRHGTTVRHPVTHADILPTLVTAAGGPTPHDTDGQDLIALARGHIAEPRRYVEGMLHRGTIPEYLALTDGRWKYIYYPEGAAEQLFDLESDPDELIDLATAAEHQRRREELRGALVARHQNRDSPWVRDGRLVEQPLTSDSVADRRNQAWLGYHTEAFEKDTRH